VDYRLKLVRKLSHLFYAFIRRG